MEPNENMLVAGDAMAIRYKELYVLIDATNGTNKKPAFSSAGSKKASGDYTSTRQGVNFQIFCT